MVKSTIISLARLLQHTTYNGDHHAVLENLQRSAANEVDAADRISFVDDVLSRGAEHRFDLHCDRLQATLARSGKYGEVKNLSVQMNRDISLHLNREILQNLRKKPILIMINETPDGGFIIETA